MESKPPVVTVDHICNGSIIVIIEQHDHPAVIAHDGVLLTITVGRHSAINSIGFAEWASFKHICRHAITS